VICQFIPKFALQLKKCLFADMPGVDLGVSQDIVEGCGSGGKNDSEEHPDLSQSTDHHGSESSSCHPAKKTHNPPINFARTLHSRENRH
jgi:hypothetical protein